MLPIWILNRGKTSIAPNGNMLPVWILNGGKIALGKATPENKDKMFMNSTDRKRMTEIQLVKNNRRQRQQRKKWKLKETQKLHEIIISIIFSKPEILLQKAYCDGPLHPFLFSYGYSVS